MTSKRKTAAATATKEPERREILVQTRRGLSLPEDRVPLSRIRVPDLWDAFGALERVAAEIRADNPTKNVVVDARADVVEKVNKLAHDTWDIAHDLRRCLQETVAPAIGEALTQLRALQDPELPIVGHDQIQRVIDTLSKAFEDGQDGQHGR